MSNRRGLVCLVLAVGFSIASFAAVSDRVTAPLTGGPVVAVKGNVHGLAKPENDLGRADSGRVIEGISLAFHPSAAQQKDLDRFLRELGDPASPNYHKYLTPKQFGARFGMSQNDIAKITGWLQGQGFTNIKVSNSRNYVSFDGTVGQVESLFKIEMHNYLVDGVVHLANAQEPYVPAALAGSVIAVGHLHDFAPKPRAKVKSNLTSYVSGNHFLSPGDFATIYDLQPLYSAGIDGTGQKIAIVGQSTVSTTDLNNFRSAAGLPASTVTMTLAGGTSTKCAGDEGESDLDIEWAGGVAKGAKIIFVYAGLNTGDSCTGNRVNSVWDALQYAINNNVAPFISTSYGYCESGLGSSFAGLNGTLQGWAQQAVSQGQTIVAASGDAGAADCESGSTSATTGYAVDAPASIPEVTGAGGNEFTGDNAGTVTGNQAAGDPPYWSGSGAGSDTVSSALTYIPEMAWNDTTADIAAGGGLSASGGGASIYFTTKPTWQTGTGVPSDGKRDVPDISVSASADHDGYLVCSEDSPSGHCASGFRDSAAGNFAIVGGTSAAAPTFSAILALINHYIGSSAGLAPINQTLYSLAASSATAFHDVTSGDNKVPCTSGTTNCPSGTTKIGFSAGVGYDQVTGLGSPDGNNLAQAWAATLVNFSLASSPSTLSVAAGESTTPATITITPINNFNGNATFSCSGLPSGATCSFSSVSSTTATLVIQTTANMAAVAGATVTVQATASGVSKTTTVSLTVTATTQSFSLTSNLGTNGTLAVAQGQTSGAVNITVASTSTPSFIITSGSSSQTALPLTYTCSGLPSESNCVFSPSSSSSATSITLTITTTAPTGRLRRPLDRGPSIFYALLLPGVMGIVVMAGARRRSLSAMRMMLLLALLALSSLWMASCGGSSGGGNKNPGTPTGSYKITVNATTGGASPVTAALPQFTLTVQ